MTQQPDQDKPSPYRCTVCGGDTERHELTVKRVEFVTFGRNPRKIKSRVVAWVCPNCLNVDKFFNMPTHKGGVPTAPQEMS